jgi:carboxyl-terminal processing protease
MHLNPKLKAAGILAVVVLAFVAGIYTGVAQKITQAAATGTQSITISLSPDAQPTGVDFKQLWAAWNLLDRNFVQTHSSTTLPTNQERIYGAIAGLTESFGDPYTTFFPPAEAEIFKQDIEGEFGGVGMELGNKDERIVVVAPLKDSPAEKAGVRAGDVLVGIDATSTQFLKVDDAVKLIRGKVGTSVKLTFLRDGTKDPVVVTIVRDVIRIPLIKNYKRDDGIYVIELYSFSANSADLFRTALREYFLSGSNKLLFDLRGNPGGYLEAAVQMASFFLPQGDIIVTEDYKGKQDNVYHRSLGYNVFQGRPLKMAILVDQGSASASEILSGALQQHNVAKLVGTRTFGKGSVQQLMDIGGGAQLKITVARWLTPNGSSISDGGLKPDIEATRTIEDYNAGKDPQKDAAVKYLLGN